MRKYLYIALSSLILSNAYAQQLVQTNQGYIDKQSFERNLKGECDSTCDLIPKSGPMQMEISNFDLAKPLLQNEYRDLTCSQAGYSSNFSGYVRQGRSFYIQNNELIASTLTAWTTIANTCKAPPPPPPPVVVVVTPPVVKPPSTTSTSCKAGTPIARANGVITYPGEAAQSAPQAAEFGVNGPGQVNFPKITAGKPVTVKNGAAVAGYRIISENSSSRTRLVRYKEHKYTMACERTCIASFKVVSGLSQATVESVCSPKNGEYTAWHWVHRSYQVLEQNPVTIKY